jgi:rhodanese-related sulfurtransferase
VPTPATITPDMTMEAILAEIPSAQRALFQRYHVGGCSSCGFQPTDTLARVCKDHNILDVNEVIQYLGNAHELDQKMQVEPLEVKRWVDAGEDFTFLDVRTPEEREAAPLGLAEPLDFQSSERYMSLPKDRKMVFTCASGMRSLDVAAYFKGHGFTNVHSLRGGIDAWRAQVDPRIPNP